MISNCIELCYEEVDI